MLSGFAAVGRVGRWLTSRRPRRLILLYHRVTDVALDPQGLCVTPQHFAEHLEVLRKHAHPLSLQNFVQRLGDGRLPSRGTVVTFDDGYLDNLTNAKPILERHDVPATVFVATGYVGVDREFWWDELERMLLHPHVLPDVIRLTVSGTNHQWAVEPSIRYTADESKRDDRWDVLHAHNPTRRHEIYRALCEIVRPLVESERRRVLDGLRAALDSQPHARPTHRVLHPNEIVELATRGLVEVGAHTVSHPQLSALQVHRQREEIEQSKAHLEHILGYPVSSFSYPFGCRSDYTAQTVRAVREAGFTSACSNFVHTVSSATDRFQLPRFLVRDWDGDVFAHRVSDALND